MITRTMLLAFLVLCIAAFAGAAPIAGTYATIDSDIVPLGGVSVIRLQPGAQLAVMVSDGTNRFRYNGELAGTAIGFQPQQTGPHTLTISSAAGELLETLSFNVVNPAELSLEPIDTYLDGGNATPPAGNDDIVLPTRSHILTADKTAYTLGETATITITTSHPEDIRLHIVYGNEVFRFLGDTPTSASFQPKTPGAYRVVAAGPEGAVIDSLVFRVEPVTVPQSPIAEEQPIAQPDMPDTAAQTRADDEFTAAFRSTSQRFRFKDATGKAHDGTITLLPHNEPAGTAASVLDAQLLELDGPADIEFVPGGGVIKRVRINNLAGSGVDLGLDEFTDTPTSAPPHESDEIWTSLYAVDPTALNATDLTVTVTATGTQLYTCKDWDFTGRECLGAWVKVRDLTPGENYTLNLDPTDPGFGETIPIPSGGWTGTVTGTTFTIQLCKDSGCVNKSTVFDNGETVYVHINATAAYIRTTAKNQLDIYQGSDTGSILSATYGICTPASADGPYSFCTTNFTIDQNWEEGWYYIDSEQVRTQAGGIYTTWRTPFLVGADQQAGESLKFFADSAYTIESDIFPAGSTLYVDFNITGGGTAIAAQSVPYLRTFKTASLGGTALTETFTSAAGPYRFNAVIPAGTATGWYFIEPNLRTAAGANIPAGTSVHGRMIRVQANTIPNGTAITTNSPISNRRSVGQTLEWNVTITDSDEVDNWVIRICSNNSFNAATRTCSGITWCANSSYLTSLSRSCYTTAVPTMNSSSMAYAFVCDTRNCSITGASVAWGVYNDTTAPTVSLVTPINDPGGATPSTSFTNTFNFFVSDDYAITSCSLYTNATGAWAATATNSTITNGTNNYITTTFSGDGAYKWNVQCFDPAGNSGTGGANYTTVIAGPPIVRLLSPQNATYQSTYSSAFTYNVTYGQNISNCSLSINGVLNQTETNITIGALQSFSHSFSEDGPYTWNIQCAGVDGRSASGDGIVNAGIARSLFIDTGIPNITLVSPADGATITASSATFIYQANDTFSVANCSIYVDGVLVNTKTPIENNANNSVPFLLNNGNHAWYATCTDRAQNSITSPTRSLLVNASNPGSAFYYETALGITGYTAPANINLSTAMDGTQNTIAATIPLTSMSIIDRAASMAFQGNGIIIPASSIVNFSGEFSSSRAGAGYITWKLYKTNGATDTLICQSGNDGAGGTSITTNARATYQNTCTTSGTTRILGTEWVKLHVDVYNSHTRARTFTHWVDTPGSYTLFNFTRLGVLTVETIVPAVNLTIAQNDTFILTCAYNCSGGSCLNTQVYAQRNSTPAGAWQAIPAAGGVIVTNGTETNPHSLGTVEYPGGTTSFILKGNLTGIAMVRCNATSDYSNALVNDNIRITVGTTSIPTVVLTSPSNNSFLSGMTTDFTYIPSSNKEIASCALYIDSTLNHTNTTPVSKDLVNSFSLSSLPERLYNWSVSCTDSSGTAGNSSTYRFTIDRGPPAISLNAPADYSNFTTDTITFNWTANDTTSATIPCNVTIDGAIRASGIASQNNIPKTTAISGLGIGFHYWNVTCMDSAGNVNTSATWRFNITNLPTNVTLLSPADAAWNNSAVLLLHFNVTDPINVEPVNCSLYINNTLNQTNTTRIRLNQSNNFSVSTFSEGTYSWKVRCVDTDGSQNTSSTRTLRVDRTPPNINLTYPLNESDLLIFNIPFTYRAIDNMGSALSCDLGLDNAVNQTAITTISNVPKTVIVNNIADGLHNWSVSCIDLAGNRNTSLVFNFTAIAPPNITLYTPANNAFTNNPDLSLIYNVSENNVLVNCTLSFDGVLNSTNQTPLANNALNSFSLLDVGQGAHTWSVSCTDAGPYTGTSVTRTLTVDTTAPTVDLHTPPNDTMIRSSVVIVNWTGTDNIDTSLRCSVLRRGPDGNDASKANIASPNGTPTTATYAGLPDGRHTWNVTCYDDATNNRTSETWSFNISALPSVTLVSPVQNAATRQSEINFTYVPYQSSGLASCILVLDGDVNMTNQTEIDNNAPNQFTVPGIVQGAHTWSVNCTDNTGGTQNSTTRTFNVDLSVPTISLYAPADLSVQQVNSVRFNYTPADTQSPTLSCNLTINGTVMASMSGSAGVPQLPVVTLRGGNRNYAWNVTCLDNVENTNTSATWSFNIIAPPNVTLLSPADNSPVLTSVNLTYNVTDPYGIANCSLHFDGVLVQDNQTPVINASANNFTLTSISPGTHNWSVSCYDDDGDYGMSATRYFSADITPPFIRLNAPDDAASFSIGNVSFNYTAWDDFSSSLTCRVHIDGVNRSTNVTANNTDVNVRVNTLPDGLRLWNVTCYDQVNNVNTSETRNFTILQVPRVTLQGPANNTVTNNASVNFSFDVSDNDGFAGCDLYLNGALYSSNQTTVMNNARNSITQTLGTGRHYWSILCQDNGTYAFTNQSVERNLTVNLIPPNISLNAPPEGYTTNTSTITFNWTANDTFGGTLSCSISVNSTVVASGISTPSGVPTAQTVMNINDTTRSWNVTCTDPAGNVNTSGTRTFTVLEPPSVTPVNPLNNVRTNLTTIGFTFLPNDNSGHISACSLILNGVLNRTNTTITNNAVNTITVPGMPNATYTWYVNCTDMFGIGGNSTPRNLSIDTHPPTIELYAPANDSALSTNVTFNWTAHDAGTAIACDLIIDGVVNKSSLAGTSGVPFITTVPNIPEGEHNWSASCRDNLNQWNTSVNYTFRINAPDFVLNETSRVLFNNTNPDENDTIMISANVTNTGGVPALANVSFWDGHPASGGILLGHAAVSVAPNQSILASISWNISLGFHTIHAIADYDGIISEMSEANNEAARNISVLRVVINAPPNATMTDDTTPDVNFTIQNSTGGTFTYRVFIDGVANGQSGTATDNESIITTLNALGQGARRIIIQANDSSRAKNSTALTIIIDSLAPQLAYTAPTPADNAVQSTTGVVVNVTHDEPFPGAIILYWNGTPETPVLYSGNFTNFTKSGLGDGIYTYYVWANDSLGHASQTSTRTVRVDLFAPQITLSSPADASTVTSNAVPFTFIASDASQFVNCTLYINGTANKTVNGMETNSPATIGQILDDGTYQWSISCTDQLGRTNTSENRTVTVAFSPMNWQGIWFETWNANIQQMTARINLSNTRDNTENSMSAIVPAFSLYTVANATSPFIGGKGAYIPNSTLTLFSGVFRSEGRDNYVTWLVYIVNDSGQFLIGQSGMNDNTNTGNNRIFPDNLKLTLSGNDTTDGGIQLGPLDRIQLVVNTYNNHVNPWNTTHYWDFRSNSFVNFTTFYTVGKPIVNLTVPAATTVVNPGETFNMTCAVNCTYGTCLDTRVYAQYNTTGVDWTNISASGTLKLGQAQQNPVSLGNLTGTADVTFTINGTTTSTNNIRCAVTSYANDVIIGHPTQQIVVNDTLPPTVTLVSPPNNQHTNLSAIPFRFNATDNVALANCSLYINGALNATNTSPSNSSTNTFLVEMGEGYYDWNVVCLDPIGNIGNSSLRNLTVDRAPAAITLNSPADWQEFTGRTVPLNYTPIDVYSPTLWCAVNLDGNTVNQSTVQNNMPQVHTATSLAEGTHAWNVTCTDLANNTAPSATRSFSVFIPPRVTQLSPANNTITNNQSIEFLFNVSDETGIANCSLLIDGQRNQTRTDITNDATNNFTLAFPGSQRLSWAIECVDSTSRNSVNVTANRTLTVDLDAPMPSIETANGTWFATSIPSIRFNITDNFDTSIAYAIHVDGILNMTGQALNATSMDVALPALQDGTYTVTVQGTDDATNAANSSAITIHIDTAPPNVTLLVPANATQFNVTSVQLNFTASDAMASVLVCNLTVDGTIRAGMTLPNATIYPFNATMPIGRHVWNATCIDIVGNRGMSQTWEFTILSPDLVITALSLSNSTPKENQTVTINATVSNLGNLLAENITVQFWLGDPSAGGRQIGTNRTIASLAIGQSANVSADHTAVIGTNGIYILVDPPIATNGSIPEENESNNVNYTGFTVGLYEIFSGTSQNTLRISDALIIDAFTWNQTETTGSNIFVADSESTISFGSLIGIGRNTTGGTGTGSNDFEELDARINTTILDDSINDTFTSAGVPISTRDITLFRRAVTDIPVMNSTNTTSFQTGIVWDAGDGGASYNGSQDVAFITVINQSQEGMYGTYDYEIRVPATLRDYIPGGGTVTFYVELR